MDKIEKGTKKTIVPKTAELTNRQKKILESVGLPMTYENLGYIQRRSILNIEKMLVYLEEKYGIPFAYQGYSNGLQEREWLQAYPVERENSEDIVTVNVNRDGSYRDNYMWICTRKRYAEEVADFTREYFNTNAAKVYCRYGGTTLTTLEDLGEGTLDHTCYGLCHIYFYVDVEKEAVKDFPQALGAWSVKHGYYGSNIIVQVDTSYQYDLLTMYNEEEYLHTGKALSKQHCMVYQNGEYSVRQGGVNSGIHR